MSYFDYQNKKLKSISTRLELVCRKDNTYKEHSNPVIAEENLKYGLAMFIAKLIYNMQFVVTNKELFIKEIESYNYSNKTSLSIIQYENLTWIRVINEELKISSVISRSLSAIIQSSFTDKPFDNETIELSRFLKEFSDKYFHKNAYIHSKQLNDLLNQNTNSEITVDFLLGKGILGNHKTADGLFEWRRNEYTRYLKDEIAASLWLITFQDKNYSLLKFRDYTRRLSRFGIYNDSLKKYLPYQDILKLNELIVELIHNEEDILNSELEIKKVFFDSDTYNHIKIDSIPPSITYDSDNSYDLILKIKYHERRYDSLTEFVGQRSFYGLLLRTLIANDANEMTPYHHIRSLMEDVSRPYIVLYLFWELKRHAEIIPYLLMNDSLTPITFLLIDELDFNMDVLKEHDSREIMDREIVSIKNQFWEELFQYFIDKIKYYKDYEMYGKQVGQILKQVAREVFSFHNHNYQLSLIKHQIFYNRYTGTLNKLIDTRLNSPESYPDKGFRPTILSLILEAFVSEIIEFHYNYSPNEARSLHLDNIDLLIEALKLSNKLILNKEIDIDENELNSIQFKITNRIFEILGKYYTDDLVKVTNAIGEVIEIKTHRSMIDFGLEIVDWGFLYLFFQKFKLLSKYNSIVIGSLVFDNTEKEKYSDQNLEQTKKIQIHLKSLLIAHIYVVKNKHNYDYSLFDTNDCIRILEEAIVYYSFKYNINEIPNQQVDAFDETFLFNNDIYKKYLNSLLYESVNLFSLQNQSDFVSKFFEKSIDIGRMLTAINRLESRGPRDVIVTKMNSIPVESFLNTRMDATHLENTLIEAINSNEHFDKVNPLLDKLEKYFERINRDDDNVRVFIFRIKLLLAFKRKDINELHSIEIPKPQYTFGKGQETNSRTKEYYLALFNLYNNKNYDKAIESLQNLLTQEPQNIDYAFRLYKARLLKALLP
jgi:hypothetical protein